MTRKLPFGWHFLNQTEMDLDGAQLSFGAQEARQPARRQRQAAEGEEAWAVTAARQQRRERDREQERARERTRREREDFGGCYAPTLEAMLQPLPKQVSTHYSGSS